MSNNPPADSVRAAHNAVEWCAGAVASLVNAATRGGDLSGAVRHLFTAREKINRDLGPALEFIKDVRARHDGAPVAWCGEPRSSAHDAVIFVADTLENTIRNTIEEALCAAVHPPGWWPLPDDVVRAESPAIAEAVHRKVGGAEFHYDWKALAARLDLEARNAIQATAALDGAAGERPYAAEAAEARTPPAPSAQPLLKPLLQDLDNEFAAKHKLSPEQMASLSRTAAALTEAMLPGIDRLGRWENEARHWYLILVGDDAPHRRRRNPDSFAVERNLWERVHPNDPEAVQWELAKRIAEDVREADKHCWGPDSCYLKQALAAYCDITAGQMARMTWEEIAAALKHAVERRGATSTSARAAAPGPPMPRLCIKGTLVLLDGAAVRLEMTSESGRAAACYLTHLLAAEGDWRSSTELNEMEQAGPCKEHVEVRWDRVRAQLPDPLKGFVESNRRKGYRLSPAAWHR